MKTYGEYRKQVDKVMGIVRDDSAYTSIGETEKNLMTEIETLKKELRNEKQMSALYKSKSKTGDK